MSSEHMPIPDEVMEDARYAASASYPDASQSIRAGLVDGLYMVPAIARAILDERERSSDLLLALKGLLADIEEYQQINKLGGENNHWQVISRAAIAKAEGRSA